MIKEIILENFKSHRSTTLRLDDSRLHALVGPNSAGKTSVLQALHYLSLLAGSSFETVFQFDRSPQFLATTGQDNLSVTAREFWEYAETLSWDVSYRWKQRNSAFWFPEVSWKIDEAGVTYENNSSSLSEMGLTLYQALRDTVYLKLVASNLAQAGYSEEIAPRVGFEGSGLAPTLDYLRNEAPEQFKKLQEMVQRIVPSVRKIAIKRAKVLVNRQRSLEVNGQFIPYEEKQAMTGQEVIFDMDSGEKIPAHSISEGTILTLGLLTVLINPKQPNLVLLDDIEQGLHPKAQRELIAVFKDIIKLNPNLQIIFSTHSPYIIDHLNPSQVHVFNNTNEGYTFSKRLDEHPDIEWAKQTLTTGEFWDAEGEDWVIAGEVCE